MMFRTLFATAEEKFEKQIEEKNIIYNDLSLKIEEVKTKYVSIVKPLN